MLELRPGCECCEALAKFPASTARVHKPAGCRG
jgi:hypothetical protein